MKEMMEIKLRLGRRLVQAGELASAAAYFQEVLSIEPTNPEALSGLQACNPHVAQQVFHERARAWFDQRFQEDPANHFWRDHRHRYLNTLHLIYPHLQTCLAESGAHRHILELGGGGVFTSALKEHYPEFEVDSQEFDLRFPFPEHVREKKYDLILCMEVIEHVIDRPTQSLGWTGTYTGNGVENMLSECRDLLVRAGSHARMLITTPNINNWRALHNLLMYHHPHTHYAHPREMAWEDVEGFCRVANLEIVELHHVNSWFNHGLEPQMVEHLRRLLLQGGFAVDRREDNLMAMVRPGPEATPEKENQG